MPRSGSIPLGLRPVLGGLDANLLGQRGGGGYRVNMGDIVYLSIETSGGTGYLHTEGFKSPHRVSLLRCDSAASGGHGGGADAAGAPGSSAAQFRECLFEVVPKQEYVARAMYRMKQQGRRKELGDQRRKQKEAELSFRGPHDVLNSGQGGHGSGRGSGRGSLTGGNSAKQRMERERDQKSASARDKRAKERLGAIATECEEAKLRYERECARNAHTRQQSDRAVAHAAIVQLLHVKSGKYLMLVPSEEALLGADSSCFKVTLSGDEPDERCYMRFEAQSGASASAGQSSDDISAGDLVNVKEVSGHSRTLLNVSATEHGFEEVNLKATASTPWRIHVFQAREQPARRSGLNFGQALRLRSECTGAYLAASTSGHKAPFLQHGLAGTAKQVFVLEGKDFDVGGTVCWGDEVRLRHLPSGRVVAIAKSGEDDSSDDSDSSGGEDWDDEALVRQAQLGLNGCVLVEANSPAALARSCFMIMPADAAAGRHGDPIGRIRTRMRIGWRGMSAANGESLWMTAAKAKGVHDGDSSGNKADRRPPTLHCARGERRSTGLALRWERQPATAERSMFDLAAVPAGELYEIDRVLSWKTTAREWTSPVTIDAMVAARRDAHSHVSNSLPQQTGLHKPASLDDVLLTLSSVRSSASARQLDDFIRAVALTLFVPDDARASERLLDSSVESVSFEHGKRNVAQQARVRELKFADVILELFVSLTSTLRTHSGASRNTVEVRGLASSTRLVLRLLTFLFLQNSRNQQYICSSCALSDQFLRTLKTEREEALRGIGQITCLGHLVRGNSALIERFALGKADSLVVYLIEGLVNAGMHHKYLRCLQAFLSGADLDVKRAVQELLFRVLNQKRGHVFIELAGLEVGQSTSDAEKWRRMRADAGWDDKCGTSGSDGSRELQLYASWTSWWGDDWCPGEGFFYSPKSMGLHSISKRDSGPVTPDKFVVASCSPAQKEQRSWVALSGIRKTDKSESLIAYFASLIDLCADLCADRAYPVIAWLQKIFKLRLCVALLRDGGLHPTLRAAIARLILHCYVDRFPYRTASVPRPVFRLGELCEVRVERRKATHGYRAYKSESLSTGGAIKLTSKDLKEAKLLNEELAGAWRGAKLRRRLRKSFRAARHRTLMFLDSGRTLVVLVLLVLTSLSLLVCDFVMGQGALGKEWETLGVAITCIFIVEVIVRMVAMGPRSYFGDKFCIIDALVSVIDTLGLAMDTSSAAAAESSKGLRALRVMRFLRILRLARFATSVVVQEPGWRSWYRMEVLMPSEALGDEEPGAGAENGRTFKQTSSKSGGTGKHDSSFGKKRESSTGGRTVAVDSGRSNEARWRCSATVANTILRLDVRPIDFRVLEDGCMDSLVQFRGRQVMGAEDGQGQLLVALLRLATALLEGGHFRCVQTKRDMSQIVLELLDGRDDLMAHKVASRELQQRRQLLHMASTADVLRSPRHAAHSRKVLRKRGYQSQTSERGAQPKQSMVQEVEKKRGSLLNLALLRGRQPAKPTATAAPAKQAVDFSDLCMAEVDEEVAAGEGSAEEEDCDEIGPETRDRPVPRKHAHFAFQDSLVVGAGASKLVAQVPSFGGAGSMAEGLPTTATVTVAAKVAASAELRQKCNFALVVEAKKACWLFLRTVMAHQEELQLTHALSLLGDACGDGQCQPWKEGSGRPRLERLLLRQHNEAPPSAVDGNGSSVAAWAPQSTLHDDGTRQIFSFASVAECNRQRLAFMVRDMETSMSGGCSKADGSSRAGGGNSGGGAVSFCAVVCSGRRIVDWLLEDGRVLSRTEAVALGQRLLTSKLLRDADDKGYELFEDNNSQFVVTGSTASTQADDDSDMWPGGTVRRRTRTHSFSKVPNFSGTARVIVSTAREGGSRLRRAVSGGWHAPKDSIKVKVLGILDSTFGVITLFLCVIVALVLTFLDLDSKIVLADEPYNALAKFTTAVFIVEVSFRIWAMEGFFSDKFCLIDLAVTVVDIVGVAMEAMQGDDADAGSEAKAGAMFRALKVVRVMRVLRVLRLARYAGKLKELRENVYFADSHLDIRAMKRLHDVLPHNNHGHAGKRSSEFDSGNQLHEALDMATVCDTNVLDLSLDLMMHADDDLFTAGFSLVQRAVQTRHKLVQQLSTTHIASDTVADVELVELLDEIRCELEIVRAGKHSRRVSVTAGGDGDTTLRTAKQPPQSSRRLSSLISDLADRCTSQDQSSGAEFPQHHVQEALHAHGIIRLLLEALALRSSAFLALDAVEARADLHGYVTNGGKHVRRRGSSGAMEYFAQRCGDDQQGDESKQGSESERGSGIGGAIGSGKGSRFEVAQNERRKLDEALVRLMRKWTFMNRANQNALAPHIHLLVREVHRGYGGLLQVIGSLFSANARLGDAVGEEVVWQLVALIEAARDAPSHFTDSTAVDTIDVLKRMVVSPRVFNVQQFTEVQAGVASYLMQSVVLVAVTSPKYRHVCLVGERFKREQVLAACEKAGGGTPPAVTQCTELDFHIKLVELLALCCSGRVGEIEATCVKMLPLGGVLDMLKERNTAVQRNKALLRAYCLFLSEVYFETELQSTGWHKLVSDLRVWELLSFVAKHWLGGSGVGSNGGFGLQLETAPLAIQEFVVQAALPLVASFFTHVWDSTTELSGDMRKIFADLQNCVQQLLTSRLPGVQMAAFSAAKAMKLQRVLDRNTNRATKLVDCEHGVQEQEEFEQNGLLRELRPPTLDVLHELTHSIKMSSSLREREDRSFDVLVLQLKGNSGVDGAGTPVVAGGPGGGADGAKALAGRQRVTVEFGALCARMMSFLRQKFAPHAPKMKGGSMHSGENRWHVAPVDVELGRSVLKVLARCVTIEHPRQDAMRAVESGDLQPYSHAASGMAPDAHALVEFKRAQATLAHHCAAEMVIELVAYCRDEKMVDAALTLGAVLVFGGNHITQRRFVDVFRRSGSSAPFFERVQALLRQREAHVAAMSRSGASTHDNGLGERHLLLFLQNLCEGHFEPLQLMLLEQPFNIRSRDLLADCVQLLCAYTPNASALRKIQPMQATTVVFILSVLVESVEGPRSACQDMIATHRAASGTALESLKILISCSLGSLAESDKLLAQKLKLMAIKLLVSLLEGRYKDGTLHHCVADVVPPILLKRQLVQNYLTWPRWIREHRPQPVLESRSSGGGTGNAGGNGTGVGNKEMSFLTSGSSSNSGGGGAGGSGDVNVGNDVGRYDSALEAELVAVLGEEARDLSTLGALLREKDESYQKGGLDPVVQTRREQQQQDEENLLAAGHSLVAEDGSGNTIAGAAAAAAGTLGANNNGGDDDNEEGGDAASGGSGGFGGNDDVDDHYIDAFLFFHGPRQSQAQPKLHTIEFMWGPHLGRALYIKPKLCQQLTPDARSRLLRAIDFTPGTKIRDFMLLIRQTFREMVHRDRLTRKLLWGLPVAKFLIEHLKTVRKLVLALSVIVNCLLVLSTQRGGRKLGCEARGEGGVVTPALGADSFFFLGAVFSNGNSKPTCAASASMAAVIYIVGCVQLFFALLTVFIMTLDRFPVALDNHHAQFLTDTTSWTASISHRLESMFSMRNAKGTALGFLRSIRTELSDVFRSALGIFIATFCGALVLFVTHGAVPQWFLWFVGALLVAVLPSKYRALLHRLKATDKLESTKNSFVTMYCVVYDTLAHDNLWFYSLYCATTVAGLTLSPFFFSLQLFEIVLVSNTLQNVISAVTSSALQLGMASLLALAMLYMFASFGFFFLPQNLRRADGNFIYENGVDVSNIADFFLDLVHHALVEGGGSLTENSAQNVRGSRTRRFLYDIAFFVTFIVLLLNMIFGIIIDKFGSLRDAEAARRQQQDNFCFICGISKVRFDTVGLKHGQHAAFEQHVKEEHSLFSYFDLFIYLLCKNPADYTGADSYLRECLDQQKLDWVPLGRSMRLDEFSAKETAAALAESGVGAVSVHLAPSGAGGVGAVADTAAIIAAEADDGGADRGSEQAGADTEDSFIGVPNSSPPPSRLTRRLSRPTTLGSTQDFQLSQQQGMQIGRVQREQEQMQTLLLECKKQQEHQEQMIEGQGKVLQQILQLIQQQQQPVQTQARQLSVLEQTDAESVPAVPADSVISTGDVLHSAVYGTGEVLEARDADGVVVLQLPYAVAYLAAADAAQCTRPTALQ